MNNKYIGLFTYFISATAIAADGHLTAEIDNHKINLAIECEDTPVMLHSYSDISVKGKSDSDGDGIFFTLGGLPSTKTMLGVFNIQGEKYKFKHKGEFTLKKIVVPETKVTRKDESTYLIKLDLSCS